MTEGRKFVIGDIHGAFRALKQCLERASFNYTDDQLIALGDLCDGWPEVNKVIDELQQIPNLKLILGNHDSWALQWMLEGTKEHTWMQQGGNATIKSYPGEVPGSHVAMLKNAQLYHIDENSVFVHGGFRPDEPLNQQNEDIFLWDRVLVREVILLAEQNSSVKVSDYDEIFVGHTPTLNFGTDEPIHAGNLWMMDTGAGWPGGRLTLMDLETRELYFSDRVDLLYPEERGRA